MKAVFTLLLLLINVIYSDSTCPEAKRTLNVGTVLFTEADNSKQCWSSESLALLTSRMILEDILPSPQVLTINNEEFVSNIVDYFRLILEVVRQFTFGKTKHIMLLALTDLLGGYLNHIVLPIAKYSYYAGHINYDSAHKLYELHDELKCFLRTNGHGWRSGIQVTPKHVDVQAIPLEKPQVGTHPCDGLIYDEAQSEKHGRHARLSEENVNPVAEFSETTTPPKTHHCDITVPMPFFDSKTKPTAIAIPFKRFALRNMHSKASAYILVKYYLAVTKCMMARNVGDSNFATFNNKFYTWIQSYVSPLLKDDSFYAAFGGVLRVMESLKRHGVGKSGSKTMGNYNLMPEMAENETPRSEEGIALGESQRRRHITYTMLLCALLILILLFAIVSLFICYRGVLRAKGRGKDTEGGLLCRSSNSSSAIPCHLCPSMKSSKGIRRKLFSGHGSDLDVSSHSGSKGRMFRLSSSHGLESPHDRSYSSGSESPRSPSKSSASRKKSSTSKSDSGAKRSSIGVQDSLQVLKKHPPSVSKDSLCTPCVTESTCRRMCVEHTDHSAEADFPEEETTTKGGSVFYPTTYACHTSMTGKYKTASSTDGTSTSIGDRTPYVFGYDFQTSSSESSPRGKSPSEGETDYKGNMSK